VRPRIRKIARWTSDQRAALQNADPDLPAALDDHAADNWRRLIALADLAGGAWPTWSRAAAQVLSDTRNDEGIAVAVLAAMKQLFALRGTDRLGSRTIVKL
jgi:putative DNA primase/helicase